MVLPLYIHTSSVFIRIIVNEIETLNLIGEKTCLKECSYRSGRCKSIKYDRMTLRCSIYDGDSIGVTDPSNDYLIVYGEKDIQSVNVSIFKTIY